MANPFQEAVDDELVPALKRAQVSLRDMEREFDAMLTSLGVTDPTTLQPANLVIGYYVAKLREEGATREDIRRLVEDVAIYVFDDPTLDFGGLRALPIYPRARRGIAFCVDEIRGGLHPKMIERSQRCAKIVMAFVDLCFLAEVSDPPS